MAEAPIQPGNPGGPVLLVVEQEAAVRRFLRAALTAHGFRLLAAANGREALEIYRRQHDTIDLVLMDVHMPELTGPQTLTLLRQIDPQVRCCFMSGDTGLEHWPELIALGALRVFAKPFPSVSELVRILRQLSGGGRPGTPW